MPYASEQFVKTDRTKFMLGGQEFRFAGANGAYLLLASDAMIDDFFERASAIRLRALRVGAHLDGTEMYHHVRGFDMQPKLGLYDDIGFGRLGYVVKKANEKGIRLVAKLCDNWKWRGGIPQYTSWVDSATTDDDFFTNKEIRSAYKNYVHYLLNYTNPYTGRQFKDEPAIMSWQLINEPRVESDSSGDTFLAWVDEMTTFIRQIDDKHLISIGDEGWFSRDEGPNWAYFPHSGVDWDRLMLLPNVDFGTFHLWPTHWDFEDQIGFGNQWIIDHAKASKLAHKPVVLEEYGLPPEQSDRPDVFRAWTQTAFESGISGTFVWSLVGMDDTRWADENGMYPWGSHRVFYPSEETDVISAHADNMWTRNL